MATLDLDHMVERRVAQRLTQLRSEHHLTLSALSDRSGLSASHLSRLEQGMRQPSIGSLLQLARAYGVPLGELVGESTRSPYQVFKRDEVPVHQGRDGEYVTLSGAYPTIAAARVNLKPNHPAGSVRHPGEEWLYVLHGNIELHLDREILPLAEGEAVHFDSSVVHGVSTRKTQASVLIVSTAAAPPQLAPTNH